LVKIVIDAATGAGWVIAITAQLQKESEDFVLKGGVAVQLHLPIEM
jgi:hypothetical protein